MNFINIVMLNDFNVDEENVICFSPFQQHYVKSDFQKNIKICPESPHFTGVSSLSVDLEKFLNCLKFTDKLFR